MAYPLTGLRVVDFGWVAAGPMTGKLLADMGAEVIKVESRTHIDSSRFTPENIERDIETDPFFHALNRNKLGISVNMDEPEGVDLLKRLISISDIVIENFFPGALERRGLDYKSLQKDNAGLVMLSLPGFGLNGSLAQTPAYAMTLSAFGGLDSSIGYPGERVLGMQNPFSDANSAIHGALAILAAIVHREKTGEGQFIELPQMECLVSCLGEPILDWLMNKRNSNNQGAHDRGMAPHNNYPCKGEDKWISIAVKTEKEWENLRAVINNPSLSNSGKFDSLDNRLDNQDELDKIIAEWTINYTDYEAMEILQKADVAAFPCMDIDDRYLDPHFNEREIFIPYPHPATGGEIIPNVSWKMSVSDADVYRPAPMMGEHNKYVFGDLLGLSDEIIDEYEKRKILY